MHRKLSHEAVAATLEAAKEKLFADAPVVRFENRLKMTAKSPVVKVNAKDELDLKLLASLAQLNARKFARVSHVEVDLVARARQLTGMSQSQFASALNISKRTVQDWEQGRRSPSGAARVLVRIAHKHPKIFCQCLAT